MEKIVLEKGLEKDRISEYEKFVDEIDLEGIHKKSRETQNKELDELYTKLTELNKLVENTRDENLKIQENITYEEAFKNNISVQIPIDYRYFELRNRYYEIINSIYENRSH